MTAAVVESSEVARATVELNRSQWFPCLGLDSVHADIIGLDYGALLEKAGLQRGETDLLHGGPPCTPFSKSGYWLAYKRAGLDPKASLLDNFVEALRAMQPKAFMMENVFGLAYGNQNRHVLQRFINGVIDSGYSFDRKVLLAADYGVPQRRQRLFCAGVRKDLLNIPAEFWRLEWPEPTHSGPHETRTSFDSSLPSHRTAADAFDGLEDDENQPEPEEVVLGTFESELRQVPPGDNYLFLTSHRGHPRPRFKWRSRYWTFLLKLHPEQPAPTIQGQPGPWVGPFHWDNRRLRVAEVKRLMEFPDDYALVGTRREKQLQLGNAVPVRLGMAVANALKAELVRLGAVRQDSREAA